MKNHYFPLISLLKVGVSKFSISLVLLISTLLFSCFVQADEGRIPIYQATTITQPGYYFLTRNIWVAGVNAINIQASNVTIDLNGRLIASTTSSGNLINIADSYNNITIKNGSLQNGAYGIYYYSATALTRIYAYNLTIRYSSGMGIYITSIDYVEISGCEFTSTGSSAINLQGSLGTFTARITWYLYSKDNQQ